MTELKVQLPNFSEQLAQFPKQIDVQAQREKPYEEVKITPGVEYQEDLCLLKEYQKFKVNKKALFQ